MSVGKYFIAALVLLSVICANAARAQPFDDPAAVDVVPPAEAADSVDTVPIADAPDVTGSADKADTADTTETAATVETADKADKADTAEIADTPDTATKTAKTVKTTKEPAAQTMGMSEIIALLQQQQKDLAEQRQLLEAQSKQITGLKQELDILRAPTPVMSEEMVARTSGGAKTETETQALPAEAMDTIVAAPSTRSAQELETETGKSVSKAQTDDPTLALLDEFKGAWRLPGTDAALAIGGYVKASVVYNFDPLEIKDRFIVGSIPVGENSSDGIEAQSSITASQSRLNFDLREPTDFGLLRAFIEGDFAEENDTFRLRHAFGQWNRILAGKTWSAFVDTQASPEEVDFEGLNGRINVRQSQVRIMPSLGKDYEFQFSMEDPNPQVEGGKGVTRAPDLVATGRFQPNDRLHVKLGLLARQIRAQQLQMDGGGLDKEYAWGLTVSGRFTTPKFDERDSLLFQLNAGNGIGRYVNDLASVGEFDGIMNPLTGELELYDIVSGYASLQHWWTSGKNMRSNFTLGVVSVDNPGFVSGDAYKQTVRASTNILWAPASRIDLGIEFLWGKRENEDGQNNTATQIQLGARYRF